MHRLFESLSINAPAPFAPLLRQVEEVGTDGEDDGMEGGSAVPGAAALARKKRKAEKESGEGAASSSAPPPPPPPPPDDEAAAMGGGGGGGGGGNPPPAPPAPPVAAGPDAAISTAFTDAQKGWSLKKEPPPRVPLVPGTNFTPVLYRLYTVLGTAHGKLLYKRAMRVNMRFKVAKYRNLKNAANKEAMEMANIVKKQQSRMIHESGAQAKDVMWQAYEKVSGNITDLQKEVEVFREIEDAAITLLKEANGALDTDGLDPEKDAHIIKKCDKLRANLEALTVYNNQAEVLDTVAEVVLMFLNNPYTIRDRFMNFLFLGAAGTGKTTLVRQISKVFVSAGLFVYDTVREGGRGEFIAQYEGQTVSRTTDYLKNSLDHGVIFIDEAYSLTTWKDGQCDGYGQEATSAIVDFMTKYKGLYCLMAAGYQKEMSRYFLPANPGLDRRFTYRSVVRDYDARQLVNVFKRKILEEQGIEVDGFDPASLAPANQFFRDGGWEWLRIALEIGLEVNTRLKPADSKDEDSYPGYELDKKNLLEYTNVRETRPVYKLVYEVFKAQAGAMSNLAEEFALLVSVQRDTEALAPVSEDDDDDMDIDKDDRRVGEDGLEYPLDWDGKKIATTNDLQKVADNRLGVGTNYTIDDMKNLVERRLFKMNVGGRVELEMEWDKFDKAVMGKVDAYYSTIMYAAIARDESVYLTADTVLDSVAFAQERPKVGDVEDDITTTYDYEEPEWEKERKRKEAIQKKAAATRGLSNAQSYSVDDEAWELYEQTMKQFRSRSGGVFSTHVYPDNVRAALGALTRPKGTLGLTANRTAWVKAAQKKPTAKKLMAKRLMDKWTGGAKPEKGIYDENDHLVGQNGEVYTTRTAHKRFGKTEFPEDQEGVKFSMGFKNYQTHQVCFWNIEDPDVSGLRLTITQYVKTNKKAGLIQNVSTVVEVHNMLNLGPDIDPESVKSWPFPVHAGTNNGKVNYDAPGIGYAFYLPYIARVEVWVAAAIDHLQDFVPKASDTMGRTVGAGDDGAGDDDAAAAAQLKQPLTNTAGGGSGASDSEDSTATTRRSSARGATKPK